MTESFGRNVFVNCPYDQDYRPLLRPLLFTIIYARLNPRLALERMDAGQVRISKIIDLVRESRYAIHDLSRVQAREPGELFRLNMPFELGLDVGCRAFSDGAHCEKRCLILEKERYRYQAALSDIAGSDIGVHSDDPEEVVTVVRNWLNVEAGANLPGPARIWDAFNEFMAYDYDLLVAAGYRTRDIPKRPVVELIDSMRQWVPANT